MVKYNLIRLLRYKVNAILIAFIILLATTPTFSQSLPTSLGWYQIPNTKLRSVCPPSNFGGSGYDFTANCPNVTEAWNSAVFDSKRNRLIVWGGGHNDYLGNELYALDMNSLTVQRLTDPGLPLATSSTCPEALSNNAQPNSRHTYDALAYMANVDRMFVFGGARATCGWFSNATWTFNFATSQWEAQNPSGLIPRADPGVVTAYDPNTGKVYLHDNMDLYAYAYASNAYQKLSSNSTGIDYHLSGAIDPVRKKFVLIGGGQAWIYDISTASSYLKQPLNTTNGSAIINSAYPGLAYDPASDRIIAWNGGDTVYSLNLDTNSWSAIANYAGGPGAARQNGTYKRWNYSPSLNAFVLINSVDQNAYTFRLSSVLGSPPSDTQAPSVPTNVVAAAQSGSQINVTWSASTDNVGVTGYKVFRTGTQIATVAGTSFQDTALSAGTTYSYTVAAYDAAGNFSGQSSPASATTTVAGTPDTGTLLVKFGSASGLNTFGLSGWSTVIKDIYTDNQNIGPGGTTIVVGDNYSYNYQGIVGSPRSFLSGDIIKVTWYNNSSNSITFAPNISFTDPDRISMGTSGTWYPMTSVTVPGFGSATSQYTFTSASAGSYSLVNVNVNYANTQTIIADKIELLNSGSTTSAPAAPTVLLSASPSTISSGGSSTLTWSSTNATSCTAMGGWSGTKALSGSVSTGNLSANTTYTLTCTGAAGTASQSVTVSINSSAPPLSGTVTSFVLTSSSTGTKPFTIGQAFKKGGVPSGQVVTTTDATDFQCRVISTWNDGSARVAILSGRSALTANVAKSHRLTLAADPGGTALTERDLSATGITASIQYGAVGNVNLESLIGQTSIPSGGRMTAGRVRTFISGPQMSSWIYYSRIGSDPHLSAWFEVRLYASGEVEVLPWVENATLKVANPANKPAATITFTLGGSQRFSSALSIPHHTRVVLTTGSIFSHWLAADPAVTPKHDIAYLQSTKMVPTYRAVTPSNSPIFSRLVQTYTPLTEGNMPLSGMTGGGYHTWIGPLPEWDVAYLTTGGDPRAYASVIANAYIGGGLDIHFRDETTNQPLKFSSYPTLVVNQNNENINATGASTIGDYTPQATSAGTGGGWDAAHSPSVGYLAYLLTGRFFFLEEAQYAATISFLINTDNVRQGTAGILRTDVGAMTVRGMAWAFRSLEQAAAITPHDDPLKTEFLNSYASNINYYYNNYIGRSNNPQGFVKDYGHYNSSDPGFYMAAWQDDFLTFAWGYAIDLDLDISAADKNKLTQFFAWKAQVIVNRLGPAGLPTGYYFADAAQYVISSAPSINSNWDTGAGPWYSNWGQIYDALSHDNPNGNCTLCTGTGNNLRGGNFPEGTSYWGNLQPAISYAVSLGSPGAQEAYDRMIGASNWSTLAGTFNDDPVWSVMPATVSPPPPPPITTVPAAPTSLTLQ